MASIMSPRSDSSLWSGSECRSEATACMQASSRSRVRAVASPAPGGEIWWELPMTQSVRYSTSLFLNFISCLKMSSSRLFIIVSTNWHSRVLMCRVKTVVSKWRTYLTMANIICSIDVWPRFSGVWTSVLASRTLFMMKMMCSINWVLVSLTITWPWLSKNFSTIILIWSNRIGYNAEDISYETNSLTFLWIWVPKRSLEHTSSLKSCPRN